MGRENNEPTAGEFHLNFQQRVEHHEGVSY